MPDSADLLSITREVNMRWIFIVGLLAGCGSSSGGGGSTAAAAPTPWTTEQLSQQIEGCKVTAKQGSPTATDAQINNFCVCIMQAAAAKYDYSYYFAHTSDIAAGFKTDGTADTCNKRAAGG